MNWEWFQICSICNSLIFLEKIIFLYLIVIVIIVKLLKLQIIIQFRSLLQFFFISFYRFFFNCKRTLFLFKKKKKNIFLKNIKYNYPGSPHLPYGFFVLFSGHKNLECASVILKNFISNYLYSHLMKIDDKDILKRSQIWICIVFIK